MVVFKFVTKIYQTLEIARRIQFSLKTRTFPSCGFSRSRASYLLPRDPIGRSRRFDRLRPNLPTWKFKPMCEREAHARGLTDPI